MLNRFVTAAIVAGFVAGLLTATMQNFTTTPLIIEAEKYEDTGKQHASHQDQHVTAGLVKTALLEVSTGEEAEAWAPQDGLERIFYTSIATIGTAFGFALILLALMVLAKEKITPRTGLLWGLAAFTATGLAPALGLSPELPGSAAAELASRQFWWMGAAMATAAGLWLTFRVPSSIAFIGGVVLIVAPHIIGAPHPHEFTSGVPAELAGHFASASLVVHAVMWSLTGGIAGYMWQRSEAAQDSKESAITA